MNLRISEAHYKILRQAASVSFRPAVEQRSETGCILTFGGNGHLTNPSLLVTEVMMPGRGDLSESCRDGLVFSAGFLRKALLRCRDRGFLGFLTVHTHPLSTEQVAFSQYDDEQDPRLMRNLYDLQPGGIFGSLVLGRDCIAGRTWTGDGLQPQGLDHLVVVGETVQTISLRGDALTHTASGSEIFDRGLAITGTGALASLSQMRIGVVGLGGTGSLMVELLMRAGVAEIVAFDFDVAERSNLNRVLHLRESDVRAGRQKTERFAEVIAGCELPTRLTVVRGGDIRDADVAVQLRECDLIVGCVDRDWPRMILSEVSYRYLIPVVDVGTEIGFAGDQVQSLDSRVSLIGPGRPCLVCSGVVSRERVRLEGYSPAEQHRVLSMGYSADITLKAPAVMDLNMRAASMAMLVIRHLLQPYLLTPLPHSIREAITNFSMRTLRHTSLVDCPICRPERIGLGDGAPLTTRRHEPRANDA